MKPISEVYPDLAGRESFYGPGDYGPLLLSMGHEIMLQVDDDDYQGDSRLLLKDGDKVGYLQFGWGSCSGCDALQACNTIGEIEELRDELKSQIRWFDTKADAHKFFEEHDWEGDYSWHHEVQKQFVIEAKALLA